MKVCTTNGSRFGATYTGYIFFLNLSCPVGGRVVCTPLMIHYMYTHRDVRRSPLCASPADAFKINLHLIRTAAVYEVSSLSLFFKRK